MIGVPLSEKAAEHLAAITEGADLELLGRVDRDTLCRYCESFARWVEAEAEVTEHGALLKGNNGQPIENPWTGISHKYSAACSRLEPVVKKILADLFKATAQAEDAGDGLGDDPDDDDLRL